MSGDGFISKSYSMTRKASSGFARLNRMQKDKRVKNQVKINLYAVFVMKICSGVLTIGPT